MNVSLPRYELFAASAPGLETTLRAELRTLGFNSTRPTVGGVIFSGTLDDVAKANLWLRTANRVLLRLGEFDAPGRRELLSRSRALPMRPFVAANAALKLHVTAHKSRLYHTGLIAEAFHEGTGTVSAEKDAPAPEVFIRFERDRCTVSIDTSGELLHRRGYRQETSHAPLRETLAASLLLISGYNGSLPLLDPMCGSGTIPIEAFLIATRRAPGLRRTFGFEAFPSASAERLAGLRKAAEELIRPAPALIQGSDIHAGALATARRNAERAEASLITWERADVARLTPSAEEGFLVTNTPYGRRIGQHADRTADDSLDALDAALSGPFRKWRAGVLVASSRWHASTSIHAQRLDNGGIPVHYFQFKEGRGA
jgi:putative N6-adenine-specific DNA methylase